MWAAWRLGSREEDGDLSLQFLYGRVFPHSPLCSGEEAPILPLGWGARSPGSHLHTAGGSLVCQGSQPRRYFIFSWSLRPEFSPGPASFRGRGLNHRIYFQKGRGSSNSGSKPDLWLEDCGPLTPTSLGLSLLPLSQEEPSLAWALSTQRPHNTSKHKSAH